MAARPRGSASTPARTCRRPAIGADLVTRRGGPGAAAGAERGRRLCAYGRRCSSSRNRRLGRPIAPSTGRRPRRCAGIPTGATRPRGSRRSRSSSIPSGRASRPGTSCSRARASPDPRRHGTFADVIARLRLRRGPGLRRPLPAADPSRSAARFRKGPNNTLDGRRRRSRAARGRSAAPRAATRRSTRRSARSRTSARSSTAAATAGIEIALDIAFQASPDHPWVTEHPSGSAHRPDGTIQYAENPPKKYQDIYPFDFESEDWQGLWRALRDVFAFWIEQGVTVFRVDNPHTKAFAFWEWCIADDQARPSRGALPGRGVHPPKVDVAPGQARVHAVATRTSRGATRAAELDRVRHRAHRDRRSASTSGRTSGPTRPTSSRRPPGGRPAGVRSRGSCWRRRSSSNYGIYGPAFELGENTPREPGSEEYLDSEKYQHADVGPRRPGQPRAAHRDGEPRSAASIRRCSERRRCAFHPTDNDQLLAYSKHRAAPTTWSLVVVNLDPHTRPGRLARPRHAPASDSVRTTRSTLSRSLDRRRPAPAVAPTDRVRSGANHDAAVRADVFPCEAHDDGIGSGRPRDRRAASAHASEPAADPLWYKDAIIYEVHVRAFFDSDADGVGDFRG